MTRNTQNARSGSRVFKGLTLLLLGAFSFATLSCFGEESSTEKTAKSTIAVKKGAKNMGEIYQFEAKALDGKEIKLDQYKGDVLLIVNTASQCGFTPQYAGLESLNKKYAEKGLKILGFPCNQFGHQEPGDAAAIGSFCQKNYGVDFQMFDKIDVNGKDAHPLYKYLTSTAPGVLGSEAIKWNFTKFLIDRKGNVIKRYAPTVKPEDISSDIEKELAGS
jgi:glutathione peroxidase